jgi:hypothetical protein
MSEMQQDPSANTARFRAFVQEAPQEPSAPAVSRGLLFGGIAVAVLIVIVVLVIAL